MSKNKTNSSATSAPYEPELETLLKSFASSASIGSINTNGFNSFIRRVKIKQQKKYGKIRVMLLVLLMLLITFYLSFVTNSFDHPQIFVNVPRDILEVRRPDGYLTHGPECKIPNIDPFTKDVMTLFHKEKHR